MTEPVHPIRNLDAVFMWKGVPASELDDDTLAKARVHVLASITTMKEAEKAAQVLLPRYKSNQSIVDRFQSYLAAIDAEAKKRKGA